MSAAPDLALTQFAIETLGAVLFVLVLRRLPERFEEPFSRLSTAEESLTDESEELGILFCLSIYIYSAFNTGAARYIRATSLIMATSVLCASRSRTWALRGVHCRHPLIYWSTRSLMSVCHGDIIPGASMTTFL